MISRPSIWLVIPCAGKGKRFGSDTPKQYLPFLNATVVEKTLDRFLRRDDIAGIVLAVSADDQWIQTVVERIGKIKPVYTVTGGSERVDSVFNALKWLLGLQSPANEHDYVAVHDAARPCVRQSRLDALFAAALEQDDGAILARPVADTVKWAADSGSEVDRTLDRNRVHLAHTPQVFPLPVLFDAIKNASAANTVLTDDCSAMEWAGFQPRLVPDTPENLKITQSGDLALAEFFYSHIESELD